MEIPTPNDYAKDHGHNPFPPRWEKWLSSVREAILTSQPTAGRHVSVDEHPGKGTVINVDDTSARRPHGGVTPPPGCFDARDITEVHAIDVTLGVDADFHGGGCTGTRSASFTWHFVRINNAVAFTPGALQFKFYLTTSSPCLDLHFIDIATALSSGVYHHDFGKAGNICMEADMRFPLFHPHFSGDCCSGTLDLKFDNTCSGFASFQSGGADCSSALCSASSDLFFVNLATAIPFDVTDFTSIFGTYTASNTNTSDPNVTVTITLSETIA